MIWALLISLAFPASAEVTVTAREAGKKGMTYVFYSDGTEVARGVSRFGEDGQDGALETTSGEIPIGPIMEYWPNGNAKREWEYAQHPDGTRGLCKHAEYFKSGKMKSRVEREGCGPATKTFIFYESGIPSQIAVDLGPGDHDTTLYFDSPQKKIKSTFSHRAGKMEGMGTDYFENGKVESQIPYRAGKIDGTAKIFYDTGAKKSEMTYVAGVLEGPYKMYFKNGRLEGEGTMKAGQPDGAEKEYFEDGRLKTESFWKDGKKISTKGAKAPKERS